MRRLDLVAMVMVCAACDSLANQGRTVLRVEPPVAHAELRDEGKSLHVTLQPDTQMATIVDLSVFRPLSPGITPEEAGNRVGPPSEVQTAGHEKRYIYRTGSSEEAIIETHPRSSVTGKLLTEYELRALVRPGFVEGIHVTIRRMVAAQPGIQSLALVSQVRNDPVVELKMKDGAVTGVSMWSAQ